MFIVFSEALFLCFPLPHLSDLAEINIASSVWPYLSIQGSCTQNLHWYQNDLACAPVIDFISTEEKYCGLMHLEFFRIAIRKVFIDQPRSPNVHLSLTQRSVRHSDYSSLQRQYVSPKESIKHLSSCTSDVSLNLSKQHFYGSCCRESFVQVGSVQQWLVCVFLIYRNSSVSRNFLPWFWN